MLMEMFSAKYVKETYQILLIYYVLFVIDLKSALNAFLYKKVKISIKMTILILLLKINNKNYLVQIGIQVMIYDY